MAELLLLMLFSADAKALGGESFRERERASARLARFAPLTWRHCAASSADPEVRRRAAVVVRKGAPARPHDAPLLAAFAPCWPRRVYKYAAWEGYELDSRVAWRPACAWCNGELWGSDLPWYLARLCRWPEKLAGCLEDQYVPAYAQREAVARLARALSHDLASDLAVRAALRLAKWRESRWSEKDRVRGDSHW